MLLISLIRDLRETNHYMIMKLQEVYKLWIAEKAKTLRPVSLSTYMLVAEKQILPVLGKKEIITPEDVRAMQEAARANGLGEKSVYDCVNMLRGMLTFAARRGLGPMPSWSASKQDVTKQEEINPLSVEEQKKVIQYIAENRTPKGIGLYLALTTGITVGELCSLTWQDIDIKAKVLHVRGIVSRYYAVDIDTNERSWAYSQESSTSGRIIPLSSDQIGFLKDEVTDHLPELFVTSNSAVPTDARVLRAYLKGVFKILSIKGHQFKDLRHGFAVRCLESGCDIVTLAALLGTNSLKHIMDTYSPYVHSTPRRSMEAMMKMLG